MGSRLSPEKKTTEWNLKCLHRLNALETLFVHWPETFKAAQPAVQVEVFERLQLGIPEIAHLRDDSLMRKAYRDEHLPSRELLDWVRNIWHQRDELLKKL